MGGECLDVVSDVTKYPFLQVVFDVKNVNFWALSIVYWSDLTPPMSVFDVQMRGHNFARGRTL